MIRTKLFSHQKETITQLAQKPIFFDMSEPGTGKTRAQVEDVSARRKAGSPPALIFATCSTLESAWKDDFIKFAPHLKVVVATAKNREKAFAETADVYITNHDAAKWLVKQPASFWVKFKGGIFITDESTAFKHHTSQRSKAAAKIATYFKVRRMMSGLPNPNGILDLWHQMFILDKGKRLGSSFFAFRSATCYPEQVGPSTNMVKWHERDGVAETVTSLIGDISIQHKFEDCVDIPKNHEYIRSVALEKTHMHRYSELEHTQVTEAEGKVVTAINKAALRTKLLQMASGAVYGEEGYVRLSTARYELVLDLVEECPHSVVFFQWKHQRDELVQEAERRGITFAVFDGETNATERTKITHAFQAGFYRVIFAHPMSAAHGLTWVRGTRTIWASPTDNAEWYKQGLRRIYRIGQTQRTETITIVAKNTYDEIAWERLSGKKYRIDEFANRLRLFT